MLKRILCAIAAILILLSLTACLTSGDKGEVTPSAGVSDDVSAGGEEITEPPQGQATEPPTGEDSTGPAVTAEPGVPAQSNKPEATNSGATAKPVVTTTRAAHNTNAPTTTRSQPANTPAQKATYPSSAIYRAVKAGKYYIDADNVIIDKSTGKSNPSANIKLAGNGSRQYMMLTIDNRNSVGFYTVDGKTFNALIKSSGVRIAPPGMTDNDNKKTFDKITDDFISYGTYQRTTIEGNTIVEHYRINSKKTKRYIFQNNNNKPGDLIGLETEDGEKIYRATIKSYNNNPSNNLFKTPAGYLDPSKLPTLKQR